MKTITPTLTLTGYLGRDADIRLTASREYSRTEWDPIADGEVTIHSTRQPTEWASLSLAVHRSQGSRRTTEWVQLRAWDLDHHPDEARIRTARKGQRVEVQGHWETHRYTDTRTGEQAEFRYLVITSFRPRPGRLLTLRSAALAA